jgi:tripartite-type tricarboxylate transporter receptor subunit TctC
MIRRRALLATPAIVLPAAARAQAWPSRPVRIVVPYPPGGSTDVLGRTLAAALQQEMAGSSFVVDNRPGGAAVVGTHAVAQAAPDGYTLSLGNNQTHAANAAMLPSLPFDPVADFTPIARVAAVHHAIVVPANGPRTLAELAARGKGGGRVTYASSGAGSASHVIAETFVRREGMEATHVPYRGGAAATTDTVAGTVDFFVSTWPQVVALVRDGRLRALGIDARRTDLRGTRRARPGRRRLVRVLGPGAHAGRDRDAAVRRAGPHPGGGRDAGTPGRPGLRARAAARPPLRRLPAGGGGALAPDGGDHRHPAAGLIVRPRLPRSLRALHGKAARAGGRRR